jgi:dihydroorotase
LPDLADLTIRGARWFERGVSGHEVDVVVRHGLLTRIGPDAGSGERGPAIDAAGAVVCPGFTDLHAHLREPGEAQKETIDSGARAAAAGGFTRVVAMANTSPPVDNLESLALVQERSAAAPVRILPVAAVTRGLKGQELTDFNTLAAFGAVAFSDDGRHAYDAALAAQALTAAAAVERVVLVHAQDERACPHGQADPAVAQKAGLDQWPCDAEVEVVRAIIDACRTTDARAHLQHLSCAASVALVREAKASGLRITAEVTPHHLTLTSERVMRGEAPDPQAKVNPPLRPEDDRRALAAGLADGTIDTIATDHAPHDAASKNVRFQDASFGFSGFETALASCLSLVTNNELSLDRLVHALTWGPRDCLQPVLSAHRPGLRPGEPADLVLFDPDAEWTVAPDRFLSRGHNTPLAGQRLRGRVLLTIAGGAMAHIAEDALVA